MVAVAEVPVVLRTFPVSLAVVDPAVVAEQFRVVEV